jgi:hypothetical protein
MKPVAGIFARFAKNLVTRLAGIEDEGTDPYIELVFPL